LQPVQRRVTPCNTIFAHLMPGFLPLSPPMLLFFALQPKHVSSKVTTEPPLLAGCELGCARAGRSVVSVPPQLFLGCFRSFWQAGGQLAHLTPLPFPSKHATASSLLF